MTERLREMQASAVSPGRELSSDDDGVSPVVGMILVLAISIVGIAAILYWGLPTIDEMKANVEYRSVQTQFTELDSTIKELVAGTTEKTAKRWQPAINRGQIAVKNNTEPWLFAVETKNASGDMDFRWYGFTDGDNQFSIYHKNATALTSVKIEAYLVTGTSTLTGVNVTGGSATAPAQMTTLDLPTWDADSPRTFSLYVKDAATQTPQNIAGGVYKFRIYTGSSLVAEAWFMNTGRVDYDLHAGVGDKSVVLNNGATIAGQAGQHAIVNTPPIPPPSETGGVTRYFMRSVILGGNASFAGENRFDLLISLYSTSTLASYDCALTDASDCVESVKLYIFGDYQAPWYTYLKNTGRGYVWAPQTDATSGIEYLEDRRSKMGFTLIASDVKLVG